MDYARHMRVVEQKLDEQFGKGISTNNLEWLCKLSEIAKNLRKAEYYEVVTEAMNEGEYSHNDGEYSERGRRRDSRGRYSRSDGYDHGSSYRGDGYSEAKDRYMDAKHSYRSSRSADSRRDVMATLDECKHKFREELQGMLNEADTREERDKIKEMLREIGNLA